MQDRGKESGLRRVEASISLANGHGEPRCRSTDHMGYSNEPAPLIRGFQTR